MFNQDHNFDEGCLFGRMIYFSLSFLSFCISLNVQLLPLFCCFSFAVMSSSFCPHGHVCVCVTCSVVSNSLQPHGLYSLPVSFVHGIHQARTLEWVAISFSRGSARPSDGTWVSCIPADSLLLNYQGSPWPPLQEASKSSLTCGSFLIKVPTELRNPFGSKEFRVMYYSKSILAVCICFFSSLWLDDKL